jgi:Zn finger protein HypA/HybF involved in hydrogenase expression
MTSAQPELVRCSSCRRDYALAPFATGCPACGGASWVIARIAERDAVLPRFVATAQ